MIERDALTAMGPLVCALVPRQAARTVACASPPCAPTPGISSGTVGARPRTRSNSCGVGGAHHQAKLAVFVPWALRKLGDVFVKAGACVEGLEGLVLKVIATRVGGTAQQKGTFSGVA